MKSFKLKTRFVVSYSIIIVIFTFILSSIVSLNFIIAYTNEVGNELEQKSLQMTNILERFLKARTSELEFISKLGIFKDKSNTKEIREVLDGLKEEISQFVWVGFVDINGVVIEATDNLLKGKDISDELIFKQALSNTYLGDVHENKFLIQIPGNTTDKKLKLLDISTPIFSEDGKLIGVLATYLDWNGVIETEKTMDQHIDSEVNTEIFVIRSSDNLVLLGPDNLLGTNINLESVDKARLGESGWKREKWPDGNHIYYTSYTLKRELSRYDNTKWIVLVRQPIQSIYGYLKENTIFAIKFAVSSATLFAIIGLITANRIAKPLKLLTIYAIKLREGEAVEIPKLHGVREIEQLTASLDSLIKSLAITKDELGEMTGLANHDKLTQLPNRIALDNHLHKLIENSNDDLNFTLLYMDLDGFKSINDTYGHHVGDLLLQEVANRIKACIATEEVVARIGGDEFVAVVNNSKEEIRTRGKLVANKIIKELSKTYILERHRVKVGCSVGGALWKIDSTDIIELASMADEALYQSKNKGKGVFTYYHKNDE